MTTIKIPENETSKEIAQRFLNQCKGNILQTEFELHLRAKTFDKNYFEQASLELKNLKYQPEIEYNR